MANDSELDRFLSIPSGQSMEVVGIDVMGKEIVGFQPLPHELSLFREAVKGRLLYPLKGTKDPLFRHPLEILRDLSHALPSDELKNLLQYYAEWQRSIRSIGDESRIAPFGLGYRPSDQPTLMALTEIQKGFVQVQTLVDTPDAIDDDSSLRTSFDVHWEAYRQGVSYSTLVKRLQA